MAIVQYRNQSGILYAYDQKSEWDPVRKQSRSSRVFLGRVDEETGEIIKTSGKRGRKAKNEMTKQPINGTSNVDYEKLYMEAVARIKELETKISEISEANVALLEESRRAKEIIASVHAMTR